jgi:hypothetical protein
MAQALLKSDNQRTLWNITMPAHEVLEGAENKLAFHKERLAVWEKARDETIAKIKSNGVVIDESVLNGTSQSSQYSNSGRAPSVMIDNELMTDLNETNTKINDHKDKVRGFDSWVQFLSRATDDLDLTLSDYLYFFGK